MSGPLASSSWLTIRVQFVLAAVFVVAGVSKILDPPGFAHEIHNYGLVPGIAVNAMALVLPWIEVVCGLALFLGIARRSSTRILGVLLVVFVIALGINLLRGHPVDCGCFGTAKVERTQEERLRDMKWAIARDIGLLLLVAQSLAASRREERA
ncbi:MAG TPA: MauE/DoxX family redox-associated membrane protein [Thermoanaerobaculia bacterium]|nr:MauE/DoxX family redox-associated membrane protein [Thermoanaerobaculia bacterium]